VKRTTLLALSLAAAGLAACAPGRRAPEPAAPVPAAAAVPEPEPALPPIPARFGPVRITLVHPGEGGRINARDSTFVYGSVGTGDATLRINGTPVEVRPNGAFLAFLPIPADSVYTLIAVGPSGADTLVRRVLPPAPPAPPPPAGVEIVAGSVQPRGAWSALPGERIEVAFRGSPGGQATLLLPDGRRIPMAERVAFEPDDPGQRAFGTDPARITGERVRGFADYRGYFEAVPLRAADPTVPLPRLARIPQEVTGGAVVELVIGADTARRHVQLNLALLDPARPPVALAVDTAPAAPDAEPEVIGRTGPGWVYHYFWPNGTELALTGERDGEYRVRLTDDLAAWIAAEDARLLPEGTPPPAGRIGSVRLAPEPGWVDVHVALERRLPFRVDEGESTLELTIYGGSGDTGWLQYGRLDPYIRRVEWEQPDGERYRLRVHTDGWPWGYRAFFAPNGDLVLRVRRPPVLDPDDPLRGALIAVDAGHPPGGATGPTSLWEPEANLAIALALQRHLEERGARVLMTRTDTAAVALGARPAMATRANADVLVSIHNNAFPDGVNPFRNAGTSVYYFHPKSALLARELQRELLAELRLRDIGIGRANLALARPTWMPAALTETAFLMIPEQEAALRDPAVIERIAQAHMRGIESFLRQRMARREGER